MIDLDRMRYEAAFWAQVAGDARRTVFCTPEDAPRVQRAVDKADVRHMITVHASPACPPGHILVVDEPALEAAQHQAIQRMLTQWRFPA